jgi:polar amino acid transport system substrate-binding protein
MTERRWTRRNFLERSALLAALAAGGGTLAGCTSTDEGGDGGDGGDGGNALRQLKSQGYITVGFAGEAPYAFKEGGDLTGEAPAVHRAIWKANGIDEVRGVQVDFGQLIPGLNAGRFNAVAAGMFILPERCRQAAFSEPVYCAPSAFLVESGNPDDLTDFQSVADAGITLAVLPGAVEGIYAKKSGVADNKIIEVASQRDGLSALEAGRAGAFALTSISLNNIADDNPDADIEVTEPFTPVIDGKEQHGCGGAVFRRRDDDLRKAFNKELAKLKKSGELLELIKPFGFGKETVPADDLTTERLCSAKPA